MNIEDIISVIAGYTAPQNPKRYAFYKYEESLSGGTIVNESNGKNYTKTKQYLPPNNEYNWDTIRFYKWDENPNTSVAIDEYGRKYAYPTEGNPVFVTDEKYECDPSKYKHTKNSSISIGYLLGSMYSVLTPTCVDARENFACFGVHVAGAEVLTIDSILTSGGNSPNVTSRYVRPIVFLDHTIKTSGRGSEYFPFVLTK